jgi:cytochrome c oxidase cbb3-type subunit 3
MKGWIGLPLLALGLAGLAAGAAPLEQAAPSTPGGSETDAQVLERGKSAYETRCKGCHRADGKGTMEEMDLTDSVWRHGGTPEAIEKVLREGVKGTGMRALPADTPDADVKALVRYVLTLSAAATPAAPTPPPAAPQATPPTVPPAP